MIQKILSLIFPRRCAICDVVLKRKENNVCLECKTKVTVVTEPVCKHCGKPIDSLEEEFCYDCHGKDFYTKKGFAVWVYDNYMKNSIAQFKYGNRREYVSFYVDEMFYRLGSRLLALEVDALIPVPLHKEKQRYRGFNQAELLADALAKKMHIPVVTDVIIRRKNTKPQKGLANKDRYQNMSRAFVINNKCNGYSSELQRVLLVDDIYTTGATIEACARELAQFGVKEVYFVCLCIGKNY